MKGTAMYRNILVPVAYDKDHDASPALEIAKSLSEPGAKVTLVHVIEDVPAYVTAYLPEGYRDNEIKAITEDLEAKAATFPNGAVKCLHGQAGRAIVDYANETGVDLIVIASHRPGLQDYLLGSTSARVVRHAQASVHVIR